METRDNQSVELEHDQKLFVVVGGEGKDTQMLTEDDNLVVFESLWHAGPLVHDLQALGITACMVTMPLDGLYFLAEGMDLGLWVLRHDGSINSVDEIIFP